MNFSSFQYKATGQAQLTTHLEIQPSHWSSPVIVGPNGVVISTGTAVAPKPVTYSRQVQNGNFTRAIAPTVGNTQLANNTRWASNTPLAGHAQSWSTVNPLAMQSGGQMALIATLGVSYQPGAGALPRQVQIGVLNGGDPLANRVTNQSTAPVANPAIGQSTGVPAAGVQAAGVQAVTKAPIWGGTTSWTPAAPAGTSSMRTTTAIGTMRPIQSTQQPTVTHTAPSSLAGP